MDWANYLQKQGTNYGPKGYNKDAWEKSIKEQRNRMIRDAYDKAMPKPQRDYKKPPGFRPGRYKRDFLRIDGDGEWFRFLDLSCCSQFTIAYFWFLRWIRQTHRIKISPGDKFNFATLGFPPRHLFKNYYTINNILRQAMSGGSRRISDLDLQRIDRATNLEDCHKLADALIRIIKSGYLVKYPRVKNMVSMMLRFWGKRNDNLTNTYGCDLSELMETMDAEKGYWSDDIKNEKYLYHTKMYEKFQMPAGGNA
jgi:hypothetical protein